MIEKLGESGCRMLIHLARAQKTKLPITEIRNTLRMGSGTIYRVVHILSGFGLIVEESRGVARLFSLTEKGKRVASLLMEADAILSKK